MASPAGIVEHRREPKMRSRRQARERFDSDSAGRGGGGDGIIVDYSERT